MARKADAGKCEWHYERHRPERTLLYQLVTEHYPRFIEHLAAQDRTLPEYVQREFEDFLKCGRLEHGFLRVRCQDCYSERLVAFSCKRRGFCPSCGARRMVESAALLVDEVLPRLPMRQWVLSFPFQLRFLFASRPEIMSRAVGGPWRRCRRAEKSRRSWPGWGDRDPAPGLERLGVSLPTPNPGLGGSVRRQGDAVNEEWPARYRRDSGGMGTRTLATLRSLAAPDTWGLARNGIGGGFRP